MLAGAAPVPAAEPVLSPSVTSVCSSVTCELSSPVVAVASCSVLSEVCSDVSLSSSPEAVLSSLSPHAAAGQTDRGEDGRRGWSSDGACVPPLVTIGPAGPSGTYDPAHTESRADTTPGGRTVPFPPSATSA